MKRCLNPAWVVLILTLSCCQAAWGQGLYLHVISASAPDGPPAADDASWPVVLSVKDAAEALKTLPPSLGAVAAEMPNDSEDDGVLVQLADRQAVGGDVQVEHLKASFVVDFHEAPVVALHESVLESLPADQLGDPPDLETLRLAVYEHIEHKDMSRGWDLASRVARDGRGDCTEHAVLLTALARSFGYPARVVIGLVAVLPGDEAEDPGPGVFGHAWSEIHDGITWRVVDATEGAEALPEGLAFRHLPLLTMDDEGPGYGMFIAQLLHVFPSHVELGNPKARVG